MDYTPLFNAGNLPTFDNLINLETLKLGYKISHRLLPKPLLDMVDTKGEKKQHGYNTRNKGTPNVQKHELTQFNKSFLCKSITLYGRLPQALKTRKP